MNFARPLPAYLVQRFHGWRATTYQDNRAWYRRLAESGQHPRAMVISCCDSRVHVTSIFGADEGEFFIHRNVANLVPPYDQARSFAATSSAMAFAISNLEVEHVIIMGHARCGGIRALMEHKPPQSDEEKLIAQWVGIAESARQQVQQQLPGKQDELRCRACEQAAILVSLENLLTYPWIRRRVEQGRLALHGWYFDMTSGELLQYQPAKGGFEVLVASTQSLGAASNTSAQVT